MIIFDSHCHIDDSSFDKDRNEVIQRANENGVSHMMIAGVTLESCKNALKIAKVNKNIFSSVGIHPHDASECSEEVLEELGIIAESEHVKAWGEIGLDFNRMYSPRDTQEKWLIKQIEKAHKLDLPLIFHERETEGRFLEMIKDLSFPNKGVVHCFSGNKKELEGYLDLGLYIGVTGIVTIFKRGENLRELLKYIPEDRILIETDAPYLTPAPQKNKTRRNEPSFLPGVLTKIAEVKNLDPFRLSRQIFENTKSLFKI